jgi:hypothetical protein
MVERIGARYWTSPRDARNASTLEVKQALERLAACFRDLTTRQAMVSGTKSGSAIGHPTVAGRTKDEVRTLLLAGHSECEGSRRLCICKGTAVLEVV